jgi:hypothetical protein
METFEAAVDGVPVLWHAGEGPLAATLRFGVGRNDEILARSGVCHAVEHLSLRTVGRQPYDWNGMVDTMSTNFTVRGAPHEVAAHLELVCRNLGDLPTGELERELRVMRVEAQGRSQNHVTTDLGIRFGASGPGLVAWPEYGLEHLPVPVLQDWADTWFTAGNAVLVLNGVPPDDLRLPLRQAPAPPRVALRPRPRSGAIWAPRDTSVVTFSLLGGREAGVGIGAAIVRERAFAQLRVARAVSYETSVTSVPLAPDCTLHQLRADGGEGSADLILSTLVDALARVREEGPTLDELELHRERWRRQFNDPGAASAWNLEVAGRILHGLPPRDRQDVLRQIDELDPGAVSRAVAAVADGVVAIGPKSLGGALPGWQEEVEWSTEAVAGTSFTAVPGAATGTLTVGPTGVSWTRNALQCRTVLWSDVTACLVWNDGTRRLIGSDGITVTVQPWGWTPHGGGADEAPTLLIDRLCDPDVRTLVGPGGGGPPPVGAPPTAGGAAASTDRARPAATRNSPLRAVRPSQYALFAVSVVVIVLVIGVAKGLAVVAGIVAVTVITVRHLLRARSRR